MRFLECVDLNPKITITKGQIYPFVEMANVNTCYRSPDNVDEKPFDSGVKFQDGDTVIARISPCLQNGKSFYCQNIGTGFGSTEYLVFRPKDDSVDSMYLYYFMMTDFIKLSMINSMTGATGRQRVNNDVFNDIEVCFPNIDIQRKIGEILSAYDNLIENNQKQINLLEEAAQRLYKEWFVDLHFPGYEDVEIVAGVPEGWKWTPFSDAFDYIRGRSYTSKQLVEQGGIMMANLKNIDSFGGYKRRAEKRYIGNYKDDQILHPGDIVMGVTDMTKERRLVGHVAFIPDLGEEMTFSMDLIKLIPKLVTHSYLYSAMRFGYYSRNISQLANGVNVLHLKPDSMMNMEMLIPSTNVMNKYELIFDAYNNRIDLLEKQIEFAKEARDRLLPKLMSGEIEV